MYTPRLPVKYLLVGDVIDFSLNDITIGLPGELAFTAERTEKELYEAKRNNEPLFVMNVMTRKKSHHTHIILGTPKRIVSTVVITEREAVNILSSSPLSGVPMTAKHVDVGTQFSITREFDDKIYIIEKKVYGSYILGIEYVKLPKLPESIYVNENDMIFIPTRQFDQEIAKSYISTEYYAYYEMMREQATIYESDMHVPCISRSKQIRKTQIEDFMFCKTSGKYILRDKFLCESCFRYLAALATLEAH